MNVGDWEPRGDGLQPVRVPKVWRDKWPARTATRAQSAAGVTARFRTDSKKLVFRVISFDHPGKCAQQPILSMTPILNRFDLKPTKNKNGEIPQDNRNAIKQVVRQRQASDRNLHLLDGLQLIADSTNLLDGKGQGSRSA